MLLSLPAIRRRHEGHPVFMSVVGKAEEHLQVCVVTAGRQVELCCAQHSDTPPGTGFFPEGSPGLEQANLELGGSENSWRALFCLLVPWLEAVGV